MKRIAVIGSGITGLTVANLLREVCDVTVFEKETRPGGLIRCERVQGSLFHICGGHVFNSKKQHVLQWFWQIFDRDHEFLLANRRSAVCLNDNQFVDYPIENHIYQLPEKVQRGFLDDIEELLVKPPHESDNFGDFLRNRFGKTLYDLYFKPYNEKIWGCDLSHVPLGWLDGKLPMPTPKEMLLANMMRLEEREFVHSSFYYERSGGSQFIVDRLSDGINIRLNCGVTMVGIESSPVLVNGERFDRVVFCGNIRDLPGIVGGIEWGGIDADLRRLECHGTTTVFCETDAIPYSWFYQPSNRHRSHRFICTGNFSPTNNAKGKMTCSIEFTDAISEEEVRKQLNLMPYNPKFLALHYSPCTYPIQHVNTRGVIGDARQLLRRYGIELAGRFAEWEYFNMDAAMDSAMSVVDHLKREGFFDEGISR